jgi:hypothetical protein
MLVPGEGAGKDQMWHEKVSVQVLQSPLIAEVIPRERHLAGSNWPAAGAPT